MGKKIPILPQEGYQNDFLSTNADIAIGGGAAGAGKTWALLYEASRYCRNPKIRDFGGIIFRRTYPQITQEGGLWDESKKLYMKMGAYPRENKMNWTFSTGSKITFRHMQHDKDMFSYQGAQIPFIAFDELTHFSKEAFFYLLTRNRSMTGVKPYMRATCNPDPDSWVAEFIEWWIGDDGYPIKERAGVIRYLVVDSGAYIWGNSKDEVIEKVPHLFEDDVLHGINPYNLIKSVTFIPGDIYGNKELLKSNPEYLANLMSQDEETQQRLLRGNWKIRADRLSLFDPFKLKDLATNDIVRKQTDKGFIIIDHARFGKDFCLIGNFLGWYLRRIDILPISNTKDITKVVHLQRQIYRGISMSQVLIDQDGIGVEDELNCRRFIPGGTPHKTFPTAEGGKSAKKEQQLFKNRKTQCAYHTADMVNESLCGVDFTNIWFHADGAEPRKVEKLFINGRHQTIHDLLRDDLRTLKRENVDLDQRKKMTSKEAQKSILGRSPDFGDMMIMRGEFDFIKFPKTLSIR